MSSLGFQLVYTLLGERDDIVCERFFIPEKGEALISIESGRPLRDFPYIFFSISFENDYLNLVRILLAGGIEPYYHKRQVDNRGSHFVLCGGVATFMNPEPIAPFADLVVTGEAEPVLDQVVDYLVGRDDDVSGNRRDLLALVADMDGLYVPWAYRPQYDSNGVCTGMVAEQGAPETVKRVRLAQCRVAGHSELLTPEAEFSELYLTELGRGCSRGCRFCAAGFIYRPPRLWDADAVLQGLAARERDVKRIGLLGMEMAEVSTMESISTYLLESGCALSFSSLRADRIDDKLLDLLSKSALKSVAIAPDGTSERLRHVINKGLSQKDLLDSAVRLVDAGIFKLKVYVMVGLPTETCEDLQEFLDLLGEIRTRIDAIGKRRGRLTEIYLSVNCFVAKPWTPFQYHPFGMNASLSPGHTGTLDASLKNLKEKIAYLKKGVKKFKNVHFQVDKPENAAFQALLSRGDRRLADVLYTMAQENLSWKRSLRQQGLNIEQYILRGMDNTSYFPWYILDHGIEHDYFWREYLKGLREAPTEPCDTSVCRRCGVCGEN